MQYFKNVELADIYKVSEKAVRNWIEATKNGKLDLQLYAEGKKTHIANTSKNLSTIQKLVEVRKKYVNVQAHKTVVPLADFRRLYSQKQIFDIISNIDIHREIPRQYNYFNGGATYWDGYAKRLWDEEEPNLLKSTIKLLDANTAYIDSLLADYRHVNVIDIGVGNCLPVRNLLQHFLDQGRLKRYVAIDVSRAMLEIAEQNIKTWFGDRVVFEGYERDINYDRFGDILAEESLKQDPHDSINLVLFLGGTLANFRSPDEVLKVIYHSMGRGDLLVHTIKLDSERARRFFDFNIGSTIQPLVPQHRFMLDLLNIDESYYEPERLYDQQEKARIIRIRPKVALSIKFEFDKGYRYIELNKNDTLLLWRSWHWSPLEVINQFTANGFDLLQASQTNDHDYLLTISEIKTGQEL